MPERGQRARISVLIGAGLIVVFVAGGVSVSRWIRVAPPETPGPRAGPPLSTPAAPAPARSPEVATLDPAAFAALLRAPVDEAAEDAEERERRRAMGRRLRARIEEGARERPAGDFGGLLGHADPVPVYEDGALVGIALHEVAPDGFYARLGLREGDLVQSINGIAFDAPGAAGEVLWSLSARSDVLLEVERGGRSERLALPRERVLRELEALGRGE